MSELQTIILVLMLKRVISSDDQHDGNTVEQEPRSKSAQIQKSTETSQAKQRLLVVHPVKVLPFAQMIANAITDLSDSKNVKGVTVPAIKKYMLSNYSVAEVC